MYFLINYGCIMKCTIYAPKLQSLAAIAIVPFVLPLRAIYFVTNTERKRMKPRESPYQSVCIDFIDAH